MCVYYKFKKKIIFFNNKVLINIVLDNYYDFIFLRHIIFQINTAWQIRNNITEIKAE